MSPLLIKIEKFLSQVENHLVGRREEVHLGLACLISNGHLLIEDVPGMGKTTMAKMLSHFIGLNLSRVQFTYDLLPGDLLGGNIYIPGEQGFRFFKGPIFSELLLADELNRGSPKTQSALLEAMEEKAVSIDGKTYPLPRPFLVLATQNPLDHVGTNPLPESQLDRFSMSLNLKFPDRSDEKKILALEEGRKGHNIASIYSPSYSPFEDLTCLNKEEFFEIQQMCQAVTCQEKVQGYILDLIQALRRDHERARYLSPRATKDLLKVSRALAVLDKRNFVIPDDVRKAFPHIVAHRLPNTSGLKKNLQDAEKIFETVSIP
jgi:MoxR-like ATPase